MSMSAERDTGAAASSAPHPDLAEVTFSQYEDEERQIDAIMTLVDKELSEPYSIFTYRYFINNWPKLCILAHLRGECIGVIICKLDQHRDSYRGYIGMLVVDKRSSKTLPRVQTREPRARGDAGGRRGRVRVGGGIHQSWCVTTLSEPRVRAG